MIREGSLLIRDGRILEVGLTRRIENLAQARGSQEIDATGRVVMPGFVDCHAHLVWPAPSLGDIKIGACRTAQPSAANTLRSASAKRLAFTLSGAGNSSRISTPKAASPWLYKARVMP